MNKRTLIIVIALILPLLALAVLSQTGNKPTEPITSPGTVTATPNRLPPTDGIARENPHRPRPPATLEEARQRLKQRLADLEKMTPEQWEAEQAEKRAMGRRDRFTAENPPVQRMPDPGATPTAPAAGQPSQ